MEKATDLKLKKAYGNSQVALTKRNDVLGNIKKQIAFQQDQLKQLQTDRIYFKRQQIEHLRKAENIPVSLKTTIENNQKNIEAKKAMMAEAALIVADMKSQEVKEAFKRGEIKEIVALIAYLNSLK